MLQHRHKEYTNELYVIFGVIDSGRASGSPPYLSLGAKKVGRGTRWRLTTFKGIRTKQRAKKRGT